MDSIVYFLNYGLSLIVMNVGGFINLFVFFWETGREWKVIFHIPWMNGMKRSKRKWRVVDWWIGIGWNHRLINKDLFTERGNHPLETSILSAILLASFLNLVYFSFNGLELSLLDKTYTPKKNYMESNGGIKIKVSAEFLSQFF